MITHVIFDFDGVVVDTEPFYVDIHISFLATFNIAFTEPEVRKMAGRNLLSICTEWCEKFDLPYTPEELKQLNIEHMISFYKKMKSIPLLPGTPTLLAYLQKNNTPFCLASSNSKKVIETVLDRTGLNGFFKIIVTGDDVKEGKPNPEIFLKAAKKINGLPESCLVIEDTKHGVHAAKNANMFCIGYQNPHSGNQDLQKADIIIEGSLEQVINHLG